ncbi:MAG TPA: isoprenylcysteine carboxylmethyltransferase family protein [Paracoccaceae bacterium]|nr:isoprenylcysteine carboxylmethyltransferase family protein [Paracoccaceae bacterium]
MNSKTEDILGKLTLVVIFSYFTAKQATSVIALLNTPWGFDNWLLVLASRSASLAFLALILVLTITRLPPTDSAAGIEPRISSIIGTFALTILVLLPTGSVGPTLLVISIVMVILGTLASVYCLYFLGRSFSIMASARALVTSGPYGIVRHPLYLAEALTVLGIIIANWSVAAVAVGAIQIAFQFRRMQNEERVLRNAFPEYEHNYAKKVPMIVPFLRPRAA